MYFIHFFFLGHNLVTEKKMEAMTGKKKKITNPNQFLSSSIYHAPLSNLIHSLVSFCVIIQIMVSSKEKILKQNPGSKFIKVNVKNCLL